MQVGSKSRDGSRRPTLGYRLLPLLGALLAPLLAPYDPLAMESTKRLAGPGTPGHLLGTARMGLDPERSVVNEWGRSHDVKNLFIVDGSIWVTSGGVNPTSTIQAIALYIADQMKQRLATLFD